MAVKKEPEDYVQFLDLVKQRHSARKFKSTPIPDPFKRILKVPDILTLHSIIPIGYPVKKLGASFRRKLKDIVHYEAYDPAKYMSDQDITEYIGQLRRYTVRTYARSRGSNRNT
jgi:hypothetical protein